MQQTDPQGPLGPGAVRALKITVVVMGILIFIGLALVIARIVQLSSSKRTDTETRPTAMTAAEGRVTIPAGAAIRSVSMSGNRLAIHYDEPAGTGIVIVDATTGETLTRIRLIPEPPSR